MGRGTGTGTGTGARVRVRVRVRVGVGVGVREGVHLLPLGIRHVRFLLRLPRRRLGGQLGLGLGLGLVRVRVNMHVPASPADGENTRAGPPTNTNRVQTWNMVTGQSVVGEQNAQAPSHAARQAGRRWAAAAGPMG